MIFLLRFTFGIKIRRGLIIFPPKIESCRPKPLTIYAYAPSSSLITFGGRQSISNYPTLHIHRALFFTTRLC